MNHQLTAKSTFASKTDEAVRVGDKAKHANNLRELVLPAKKLNDQYMSRKKGLSFGDDHMIHSESLLRLANNLQPASHLRAPTMEVVGSVPVPAGSGT